MVEINGQIDYVHLSWGRFRRKNRYPVYGGAVKDRTAIRVLNKVRKLKEMPLGAGFLHLDS
jgi:hypothetical protein